ncbi:hypothetical protein [Gordonia sp. N1V]|uniref:hypothetical protein n=1 Tax=Gordonia sp. N1V TaxID=3034163 RepID=UPI0023E19D94|nr:hypothetical protein [Gordonia sp. N1V]MDF3285474.1 hypothetical protein [Gordonia sp. N1V]
MTAGSPEPRNYRHSSTSTRDAAMKQYVQRSRANALPVQLSPSFFDTLIESGDFSRSALYRVWTKSSFSIDFLSEIADDSYADKTIFHSNALFHAISISLQDISSALSSEQSRRQIIIRAIRVGIEEDLQEIQKDSSWRTPINARAAIANLPERGVRDDLAWSGKEAGFEARHRAGQYIRIALNLFGFRLQDALQDDYSIIPSVASAIINGFMLESEKNESILQHEKIQSMPGGANFCSLPVLVCTSIVERLIEPIEGFDPGQTVDRLNEISDFLNREEPDDDKLTALRRILIQYSS